MTTTKVSDAGRAWWTTMAKGGTWRDCQGWIDLPRSDRRAIERRIKQGLDHPDRDIRTRAFGLAEAMVIAEAGQGAPTTSPHLRLEMAAVARRGRALEPCEPAPGCGCERCTGIAPDPPVQRPPTRDLRPALGLAAARAVPILDVAARLGIEHRNGWAACPFHADSDPSLHLNPKKGAAFCNPCGRSWDPIALVMEYRKLTFPEAVRELAA
ncbi:MAG: CHC2 zinc finger domain-containing protein [Gemmatimonadota bacterium]